MELVRATAAQAAPGLAEGGLRLNFVLVGHSKARAGARAGPLLPGWGASTLLPTAPTAP